MANEKKTPREIIDVLLKELRLTLRAFALCMNQDYSKIYNIYSGRTQRFSESVITAISKHYHVRTDFILTGEGEIFDEVQDEQSLSAAPVPVPQAEPPMPASVTESFVRVIETLTAENRALRKRINELEAAQYVK